MGADVEYVTKMEWTNWGVIGSKGSNMMIERGSLEFETEGAG